MLTDVMEIYIIELQKFKKYEEKTIINIAKKMIKQNIDETVINKVIF